MKLYLEPKERREAEKNSPGFGGTGGDAPRPGRPRRALPSPSLPRGIRALRDVSSLIIAVRGKVAGVYRPDFSHRRPLLGSFPYQSQQADCCGITFYIKKKKIIFFLEGMKPVPACPSPVSPGSRRAAASPRRCRRQQCAAARGGDAGEADGEAGCRAPLRPRHLRNRIGTKSGRPRDAVVPGAVPAARGCSYHVGSEGGGGGGGRVGAVLEVGVVTRGRGGEGGRSGVRGKSGA